MDFQMIGKDIYRCFLHNRYYCQRKSTAMTRFSILFFFGILYFNLTAQIDLEHLMSAPYCSDITKSKDGSLLAWVAETKGLRSLYVHDLVKDTTSICYQQGADLGQVVNGLQLDHRGRWLYYFEGSGLNREGVSANPASLKEYPGRILYRVAIDSGKRDTIGSYGQVILAPSGEYILLTRGNTLFRMDSSTRKIKQHAKMRGNFASIEISEDSRSVLFVSVRGDHNFIGYLSADSDRIRWIAPGVDKDLFPKFSPDGQHVGFIRMPGDMKGFLNDITSGSEFSIMQYSMTSDVLDTLWTSPGEGGGFAQYYHADPFRWTGSGKMVFYSEHEGFTKLYSLDPDTKEVLSVIDGSCEVEQSDTSPDGTILLFSSNCGDIDRRDIFQYDLVNNSLTRLTTTADIETYPTVLDEDWIAYMKSSFNSPAAIFKSKEYERPLSGLPEAMFPKNQLLTPRAVTFETPDGYTIHGQLFDNGQGSGKPGVLFMHGGPIRQMLLGFHYSSYYANTYAFNQYLASKGYVVLSVNFRAGIGYGRDFRRAPNQGPRGASEYQDIVSAAQFLQSLTQVDGSRIGLWGGSYGGFLTAMGLARNSDIFKAGVDFHGVHDWAWRAVDFSEGGFWGIDEDDMELAYQSSPVADVATWTSPVLFIHGDDDRNVMFGQTVDLVQRLRKRDVPHELLILPDEVHGFYRWESWFRSFEAAADFFDRKL